MSGTAGEYAEETIEMLMVGYGGEKEKKYGFKPIEVRSRIGKLLDIERRAKAMCIANVIPKDWKCPACGYVHHKY